MKALMFRVTMYAYACQVALKKQSEVLSSLQKASSVLQRPPSEAASSQTSPPPPPPPHYSPPATPAESTIDGPASASFTDAFLASGVLSTSRQIAMLRNRSDMAALSHHIRSLASAPFTPSSPSARGGGATPSKTTGYGYLLPATPSLVQQQGVQHQGVQRQGVQYQGVQYQGAQQMHPLERLAIRFAIRLDVGIGLVRGEVDTADDAWGDAVRLEVTL